MRLAISLQHWYGLRVLQSNILYEQVHIENFGMVSLRIRLVFKLKWPKVCFHNESYFGRVTEYPIHAKLDVKWLWPDLAATFQSDHMTIASKH